MNQIVAGPRLGFRLRSAFGRASCSMSSNATMQQALPAFQLPQPQMKHGPQQAASTSQAACQVELLAQPFGQAFVSNRGLPPQNGSDAPAVVGQLPSCYCGTPCVELRVKKEGPNQGKFFYKCAKQWEACHYFQWVEGPPRQVVASVHTGVANEGAPSCFCGLTAVAFTVRKEGRNMGRKFYRCSKTSVERCSFFHWVDEGVPKALWQCTCGVPVQKLSVVKDGPNHGRPFFCCAGPAPGCGLFQWGDDDPPSNASGHCGVAMPVQTVSRQGSDVCYKCNQPGHWAASCPNAAAADNICYKCHQPGHWASSCPNASFNDAAAFNGRAAAADDICYKCHQPGHWASSCPNAMVNGFSEG